MDFTALITQWLLAYGSIILFVLLALGIIGLPIPDESLLVLAGGLAAQGKLLVIPTMIAGIAGAIFGISISFWLGKKVGPWLIRKFGPTLHITPKTIKIMHSWFSHMGKWTLVVCYFIPLIRHLAGFVAGTTRLEYKIFALYAYSGAIIWSLTFFSLGYFFIIKTQ